MQMLDDRVLVRILPQDSHTKTAAGIMIANAKQVTQTDRAVVVACGPGLRDETGGRKELVVNVGDTVLIPGSFGGVDIIFEGEPCRIIRESDIYSVL